jgi:hypothetical protein
MKEDIVAEFESKGNIVGPGIPRWVFRWMHIILGIPIIGYIYSPFDQIPAYAPLVRFVFAPIVLLSGLWMWKGHVVRRLFWKRTA